MNIKDKFIIDIINGFQHNKGKGSFYCFSKEIIPSIIAAIIKPFVAKHYDSYILIVVDVYSTRTTIVNKLFEEGIYDKKGNIKILSKDYVNPKYHYSYDLTITVGINDNINIINRLQDDSKFTMTILTENIMNNKFIQEVRSILPNIDTSVSNNDIENINVYSPVEEHRMGVIMSDEDIAAYDKYSEYINTSISIFGELSNIEKCKKGDIALGISAADFRQNLAQENGWSTELDTKIPYIKEIDDTYNPNILYERACNFYNIAKQRRDLVSDNESKLEAILDICNNNKDKQILVISKRGEFAAKVTKYLCQNGVACGDYHDCIDDRVLLDNNGNIITYKSGAKKGSARIVGSQAQSSLNEKAFNSKSINVLSIKSSSNVKLKIACDMVIITSPLCDNIIEVKKRFCNIKFNTILTTTYIIYCKDSIEQIVLSKEKKSNNINVIEDEENFITYDENSGDIIL